jgi:3-dehydroquinate dehydratase/shikimate dehydrogenase
VKKTDLVASLTSPPTDSGNEIRELPAEVGTLEVRADLVGRLDADWLRDRFPGRLLYTLRSRAEGGAYEGGKHGRCKRLTAAARSYDLVDLEGDRDLFPELLVEVPAERRLISWHGPTSHLTELHGRFEKLAATEARYYKLIPTARDHGDGLQPLELLQSLRRDDVVAFAAGEVGVWTRILAPYMGSPLVYGSFGATPAAPGQLPVARLVSDYGLPYLREVRRLFGIAGRPVLHSLSPRLHNGAYRALGIPALYVPFHVESFGDFWIDVVEAEGPEGLGFPLKGLSVTSPYKEVALDVSGVSSPRAQHIAAANTLVCDDEGVWEAETTDPEGVVALLAANGVDMVEKKAAVVGCGGAGKASAYGLQLGGAQVTLVNRGRERGERASEEMMLPFLPLAELDPSRFDILVHATDLGHRGEDELPFDVRRVRRDATIVDLVYDQDATRLLREARALGLRAFGGRRVLLYQALEQFRLMTGKELNEPLARDLLGLTEDE